jgi:hypothetical protein
MGAEQANQRLSEVRALAVAQWRAENRRIGFAVAGLRGAAVGGLPLDGGGRVAGDACR